MRVFNVEFSSAGRQRALRLGEGRRQLLYLSLIAKAEQESSQFSTISAFISSSPPKEKRMHKRGRTDLPYILRWKILIL